MVWGVPLIPDQGGATIAQGATGAYNVHFQRLGQQLVAKGHSRSILRLGWEFNSGWYRWAAKEDPAAFAVYWRHIVNTMRAVPGSAFTFDWNPNLGYNQFPAELAYPGDAYVDYIGIDTYDQSWATNHQDPAVRWNDIYEGNLTGGRGLHFWRDFAAEHGKPMSFPEWGVSLRGDSPEHGGGDNPDFIDKMFNFINTENVAYHIYFEFDAPDGKHCLSCSSTFPAAAEAFRSYPWTTSTGAPTTPQAVPRRVGIRSTSLGKGYWLVASDGGVFSFGGAKFYGSAS